MALVGWEVSFLLYNLNEVIWNNPYLVSQLHFYPIHIKTHKEEAGYTTELFHIHNTTA